MTPLVKCLLQKESFSESYAILICVKESLRRV